MSTTTTANHIDDRDSNPSPHQNVIQNEIPAFQNSLTHHPDHVLHDDYAEKSREDEVIYSFDEKSAIPHHHPQDHDLHRRLHADIVKEPVAAVNLEQGIKRPSQPDEDPQTHTSSNFYKRYRIFFHLFFALVFTGWWIAGLVLYVILSVKKIPIVI